MSESPLRLAIFSSHLPHPEGDATGRALLAWGEGALKLGHKVEAWTWQSSAHQLDMSKVPGWCYYEPVAFPPVPMWREHLRSVRRPRRRAATTDWQPPEDAVAVADDQESSAAVVRHQASVVTVRHREILDAWALRGGFPGAVQWERAERWASRQAALTFVHSARVGRRLPGNVQVVPVGFHAPERAVEPLDEPVVVLVAHWTWPPNAEALSHLLAMWPEVLRQVRGASLVLGGRGLEPDDVGSIDGVRVLGRFGSVEDVLSRAALMAFPCPASCGPKIKVLESLAYGLPVLTTAAGVEGLQLGPGEGAVVSTLAHFVDNLVDLLRSPDKRARLGATGRAAVTANHSPEAAARARVEAISRTFER